MRIANRLLAICGRARREGLIVTAVVLTLEDRNTLATELEKPHLAQFQGVPIIISSKVTEPNVAVA